MGERPQHEAVVGGDEVDGAALHDQADHLAVEEQALQLPSGRKSSKPGPQGDVRIAGVLGLHSDQVLDDVERRLLDALQEVLAVERRPVQLTTAQHVGHSTSVPHRWPRAVDSGGMTTADRPHRIAVIGGDGIGPEVTAEALRVLEAAGAKLDTVEFDLGGHRYVRDGEVLSDETLEELRGFDAILVGAVGTPEVPPGIIERGLLLKMRFALDLYINQRPFVGPDARVRRHPREHGRAVRR